MRPIFFFRFRDLPNRFMPFPGITTGTTRWKRSTQPFSNPKPRARQWKPRLQPTLDLPARMPVVLTQLVAESARLRQLYGVSAAGQRAPFFELQTPDFALLAIDTGILRTVDARQWGWLERALERS